MHTRKISADDRVDSSKSNPDYSKRKPTIVTLLDTPAFGGAEQYVLDSSVILNKYGHKIIIYTNNEQVKKQYAEFIEKNTIRDFEIRNLPFLLDVIGNWKGLLKFFIHVPLAWYWLYTEILQLKKTEKTTIFWLVGFSDRLILSPIIKLCKQKLLWVDIGPLRPIFQRNWGFPKLLYKTTKNLPDHFATTSKFTLSSMIQDGGIPKNKISLVYPSVATFTQKQILSLKKEGKKWRTRNASSKILIGFVGRMATENEVDVLIHAFAKSLENTKLDMQLVLVGDGPEKQKFTRLATKLGIANHIIFTGFVSTEKKFTILAASDLFVFSRAWSWDGFGITTIEAMSVGTPVISSKFGPQKEIITHNKNGLLFTPHDVQDLSKKIIDLAKNKKLREEFSVQGLQTVFEKFSNKTMEASVRRTLENVSING